MDASLSLVAAAMTPATSSTPTPSEVLVALLRERGITKAELGALTGREWLAVHRWCKGAFPERAQQRVCEALGLPLDHFRQPTQLERREQVRLRVYADFLASPLGTDATREERRILESVRFVDTMMPTVALYQAFLLALRGHLAHDQVHEAAAENAELDARIVSKRRRSERD